jgi:hypothetical protein
MRAELDTFELLWTCEQKLRFVILESDSMNSQDQ